MGVEVQRQCDNVQTISSRVYLVCLNQKAKQKKQYIQPYTLSAFHHLVCHVISFNSLRFSELDFGLQNKACLGPRCIDNI